MNTRTITSVTIAGTVGLFLALAVPLAASAHVGVDPSTTAAGGYSVLTFSVPHGCDVSATTVVTIDVPDDVVSTTPTVNPGWTVDKTITDDRVSQVTYTAKTPLPDGYRDTFQLSVALPDGAVGDALAFPVLQTCEVGQTEWNEATVEGEEEPEHPAPTIVLTAASAEGHGHDEAAADDAEPVAAVRATDDTLARTVGIGGLVVGSVGVVIATVAFRRRAPAPVE